MLGAGRKDESGDFTKGAGLSEEQCDLIMNFVGASQIVRGLIRFEANQLRQDDPAVAVLFDKVEEFGGYDYLFEKHETIEYGSLWNSRVVEYLDTLVLGSKEGDEGVKELAAIACS